MTTEYRSTHFAVTTKNINKDSKTYIDLQKNKTKTELNSLRTALLYAFVWVHYHRNIVIRIKVNSDYEYINTSTLKEKL